MKIDVDYKELHSAIEKFKKGLQLYVSEEQALIQLIEAAEGDYYPSKEESELQASRVKRLKNIDYDKNPDLFNKISSECDEFENKFC